MRVTIIAALIIAPSLAVAHADHHEDVAKARLAFFTLFGANIGPLAKMAKGEIEYDAERAALHARNFAALSAYDPSLHFEPGTSNADIPGKTRALPAIWEDRAGFGEKLAAFGDAVDNLVEVARSGRAALGGGVRQLGGSCKGCHDDFRAKDF